VAQKSSCTQGAIHTGRNRVKLSGPGEWLVEKHGSQRRRAWRKLHLGVDAETGTIVASTLTRKEVDDAAELGPLLAQVDAPLAALVADGAYDQNGVYTPVAGHSPEAAVVVPPRATAVPSPSAETDPTQRDRHLQIIAERGRMGWQKTSGYNARAGAEGAMSRYKVNQRRRHLFRRTVRAEFSWEQGNDGSLDGRWRDFRRSGALLAGSRGGLEEQRPVAAAVQ
jgi:hypothetical protein